MGKNSSGSACRQAPRDIQPRERTPDVTGGTGHRLPACGSDTKRSHAPPYHRGHG
jgi:hypothetical protein